MIVPKTARAVHLPNQSGIDALTITVDPVPQPENGQVLVRVHAAGLQFQDISAARATHNFGINPNVVPLSELSAEIVSIGPNVQGWSVGDRVCPNVILGQLDGPLTPEAAATTIGLYNDGALTQYRTLPSESLVRIPSHLSYEEAAALPSSALTAWNALMSPNYLKSTDSVLVLGTGSVSLCSIQFAVAAGATVIVTSSSDEKLKFVKEKLGATHTINYKQFPNWDEEVLKLTDNRGVDYVVEVGGPGTLLKSATATKIGGTISLIGFVQPEAPDNFAMEFAMKLIRQTLTVRGLLIGSVAQFKEMNTFIEESKIRPTVDKVFELDEVKEAYKHLDGQGALGKVVVKVSQD